MRACVIRPDERVECEKAYDNEDRGDDLSDYAGGEILAFDDIVQGFCKNNDALAEDNQGQESTSFT